MTDSVAPEYLQTRKRKQATSLDSQLQSAMQYQGNFAQGAEKQDSVVSPSANITEPTAKPVKEEGGGFLANVSEIPKQLIGGVRDAAQHSWDAIDSAAHWMDDNVLDLRASRIGSAITGKPYVKPDQDATFTLPTVGEGETTTGHITRGLSEFVTGFIPAVKALRYVRGGATVSAVGKIAESATATGVAAGMVMNPDEKRVSDLLLTLNPDLKNPVLDYLASNPADSQAEKRFKNALENVTLGLGVDGALTAVKGLFVGAKAVKAHFNSQGKNAEEAVQTLAKESTDHIPLKDHIERTTGITSTASPLSPKQIKERTAEYQKMLADSPDELASLDRDVNFADYLRNSKQMQDDVVNNFVGRINKTEAQLTLEDSLQQLGVIVQKSSAMSERDIAVRQAIIEEAGAAVQAAKDARTATPVRDHITEGKVLDLPKPDVVEPKGLIILPGSQRGSVDPQFLVDTLKAAFGATKGQAAGSVIGGATGYNSAAPDATLGDKLGLTALGALGGRVAAKLMSHPAVAAHAVDDAVTSKSAVAAVMTKAGAANIAPEAVIAKLKPTVRFNAERSDSLVKSLESGDFKKAVSDIGRDFNLEHIDTREEAKQFINKTSEVLVREISKATGGVKKFGDIEKLAEEIGAGAASLKQLYGDTANLSERVTAHRMMLAASSEKVVSMAAAIRGMDTQALSVAAREQATDAALIALRKQVMLHATIQAEMKGTQTEIARALSAMRIQSSGDKFVANEMSDLINGLGGRKLNMEFADKILSLQGNALNKFVRKGAMARTQDQLFEYWVNALLSNPATHAANIIGNSLVAVGSVAEKATASLVGLARRNPDRVPMGEAVAQTWGMAEGLIDALRVTSVGMKATRDAAGKAVRGNFKGARDTLADNADEFGNAYQSFAKDAPVIDNAAFGTKEFNLQAPAISGEGFGLAPGSALSHGADVLGTLARTPGRLLTTSDEVFKTINYRGSIKAQAYRAARGEGLSGDELTKRIAALVEEPTAEMSQEAIRAMREATFTAPLGEAGSAVQYAINKVPGLRYLMPFVRTPTNIIKYAFDRTPGLNMIAQKNQADWAAGGARRDLLIAKTAVGGSLYGAGAYLAAQGHITGGGLDDKNKSAENVGGWQPYSLKVGDKYYAYNRLDPMGMFLGLSADFSDISGHLSDAQASELASAMVTSLSKNLLSKSYLGGLTDALTAIADPQQHKSEAWLQKFVGSFIPAGVAAVARQIDPETKEVYDMIDSLKKRIPGYSQDLYPHRNLLTGDPVQYKAGLGVDIASPIYTSQEAADPAAKEIARLNVDLQHPPKAIGNVNLTNAEYDKLMLLMTQENKMGGKTMREVMNEKVSHPDWKNRGEGQDVYEGGKEHTLKYIYSVFRQSAQQRLIQQSPDLMSRIKQDMRNKGNALQGTPVVPFAQ